MLSWGTYSTHILFLLKSNLESKKTLDHTKYNYYLSRLWSPSCLCRYITENHTLWAFPRNHLFREYNVPLEQEHVAWWLQPCGQHQSFPMSQLFAWSGQSIGVSALAVILAKIYPNQFFECEFLWMSVSIPKKSTYKFFKFVDYFVNDWRCTVCNISHM